MSLLKSHKALLAEIEKAMPSMSVEKKCVAIGHLKKHIEYELGTNTTEAKIKERFPVEYDLILRLARSLEFSDAYKEMQRKETVNILDIIDTPQFHSLSQRWSRVALSDRIDFVEKIQAIHAQLQSLGPVRVDPATVEWLDHRPGTTLGALYVDITQPPETYEVEIPSSRSLLRGLGDGLSTLLHEQRHRMQATLAHAWKKGTLPADSPYKKDAEMLFHIFNSKAILDGYFGEAYRAMPHERDARALGEPIKNLFKADAISSNAGAALLVGVGAFLLTSLLAQPRFQR